MIHRFSSDDAWDQRRRRNGVDPSSPAGVKGLITREIRKRLWAALTTDVSIFIRMLEGNSLIEDFLVLFRTGLVQRIAGPTRFFLYIFRRHYR